VPATAGSPATAENLTKLYYFLYLPNIGQFVDLSLKSFQSIMFGGWLVL